MPEDPRERPAGLIYWGVVAATAAGLAAAGSAPVKIGLLLAGAALVARTRAAVIGPLLALAIVLPEAGGARPAVLSIVSLLLLPALLHLMCRDGRSFAALARKAAPVVALASAAAAAAALGLLCRDSAPSAVLFEAFQPHVHMLAFVVALAAPLGRVDLDDARSVDARLGPWITGPAVAVALLGIAQILFGQPASDAIGSAVVSLGHFARSFDDIQRNLWWGVRKAFSVYASPNGLGAAMLFALAYAAAAAPRSRGGRRRWWLGAAAIACGAALVLTFSRAAILSTMVVLAWLAWRFRHDDRAHALGCLGAAAALPLLYVLFLGAWGQAVASGAAGAAVARDIKRDTAMMKVTEVRHAAAMFREGHWLGSGYGVVFEPDAGFVHRERTIGVSPAYGEIVYRSGVAGLLALLFTAWWLRDLWPAARGTCRPGALFPLRVALAGALLLSLIDHSFLTVPGLATVFWTGVGLLARSADERRRPTP